MPNTTLALILISAISFSGAIPTRTPASERTVAGNASRGADVRTPPDGLLPATHVRLRHILIRLSPDASLTEQSQAFDRAVEIRLRAIDGEEFAALARQYSDDATAPIGGDLGWIRRGVLVQAVDDAAFSLKPGEVSSVIRTAHGLHLLKVEATRP